MDTRLLMMLQVKVGRRTISAPYHGTRRTAPLSGGSFEGRVFAVRSSPEEAWIGKLLRADGVLEMDLGSRFRPMMVRSFR